MTEFKDLIALRDAAVEHDEDCLAALVKAQDALAKAQEQCGESSQTRNDAQKAIHDLLVEYGEHYLITDDGTLTVYKPIEEEPGYLAVQPIPGQKPATVKHSEKKAK